MPVIQSVDNRGTAESEMEKKIRGEIGAPSVSSPLDLVAPLPTMNSSSRDARAEMKDDDKEGWISPMDLLAEEDRMDAGDLDLTQKEQANPEMEILDWAELQKSMIEDALTKAEPEMSEEDLEEMLQSRTDDPIDSSRSGGLEMEEVVPLQDLAEGQGDLAEDRFSERFKDSGEFLPVLPSARQMNGEVYRPERDRNPQLELSGSRGMLNELKEKWANPSTQTVGGRMNTFEMPGTARDSGLSRPLRSDVSVVGFSANNPAISRQSSAPKPVLRESVRPQIPAPQPRAQPAESRSNDYRLRSQLGASPGGF